MKPISLKIKGLNSFIEEQKIDFEKLTERGLFGIFGPTGSGKSTILDGITLALYGEISRKSTNFINTNCDLMQINYEFQISSANIKRYSVYREFKRDKKTGNPLSGKCKIVDITGKEPIILAEKVREVNEKCIEIIGLNIEDFLRTVVLPQGKFSEFLKLEGKNRREMLERLFNLGKYGDELSNKLSKKIGENKVINNQLIGEMKTYEDISLENLEDRNKKYILLENLLEDMNEKYSEINNRYNSLKEIYELNKELNYYLEEEKNINKYEEEIKNKENKIILGEGALKVNPYILNVEATGLAIIKAESEKDNLNIELKIINDKLKVALDRYTEAQYKKDNELQELKIKEERGKVSKEEKNKINEIEKELIKINNLLGKLKAQKELLEKKIEELSVNINRGIEIINNNELAIEELTVDSNIKELVQRGMSYEEKILDLKSIIIKNEYKHKELINNKDKYTEIQKEKDKALNIITNSLIDLNNKKELLLRSNPGDEKDLLALKDKVSSGEQKFLLFNKANNEIAENTININSMNNKEIKFKNELNRLQEKLIELNDRKKKEELRFYAGKIRSELKEGDLCPVCGGNHISIYEESSFDTKIEDLLKEIEALETDIKNVDKDITKVCIQKEELINKNIKLNNDILDIGQDFKETNLEQLKNELNNLMVNIESYNTNKEMLDSNINKLVEEQGSIKSELNKYIGILSENNNRISELILEDNKIKLDLKELEEGILDITLKTGVNEFKIENKKILSNENKKNNLLLKQKELRENTERLVIQKEGIQNEINILKERLVKGESIKIEKEENILDREKKILDNIGEVKDISEYLLHLEKNIKIIEDNYTKATNEKTEIENISTGLNNRFIEVSSRILELNKGLSEDNIKLDRIICEEGFENVKEVKAALITRSEINELKDEVETYKLKASKVKGAIESLEKRINNRSVNEDEYNNISNERLQLEEKIKVVSEEKIKKGEEIKLLKKKIDELSKITQKKFEIEHKLAILNDLEKLFKGKRFIEFVALNRLKYISIEASKRLMNITNGNYSLEVNENGRFIIRDYKNGGVERDTSTLSGGETFLASLALALALSSELQLKGAAPLELFFLDEGFGTLDDDLLEIVMSSLERIHNDKLKVGIISHVESIKNRVPIKLVVEPAKSGGYGSKVKIDIS